MYGPKTSFTERSGDMVYNSVRPGHMGYTTYLRHR